MSTGVPGSGAYVPDGLIGNGAIASRAQATPEWIEARTGIFERRCASDEANTSYFAYAAVTELLRTLPSAGNDAGALVLATSTPDRPQPATAAVTGPSA